MRTRNHLLQPLKCSFSWWVSIRSGVRQVRGTGAVHLTGYFTQDLNSLPSEGSGELDTGVCDLTGKGLTRMPPLLIFLAGGGWNRALRRARLEMEASGEALRRNGKDGNFVRASVGVVVVHRHGRGKRRCSPTSCSTVDASRSRQWKSSHWGEEPHRGWRNRCS